MPILTNLLITKHYSPTLPRRTCACEEGYKTLPPCPFSFYIQHILSALANYFARLQSAPPQVSITFRRSLFMHSTISVIHSGCGMRRDDNPLLSILDIIFSVRRLLPQYPNPTSVSHFHEPRNGPQWITLLTLLSLPPPFRNA